MEEYCCKLCNERVETYSAILFHLNIKHQTRSDTINCGRDMSAKLYYLGGKPLVPVLEKN